MEKRKSFENLSSKNNPQFEEDGKIIYILMKQKYPEINTESLDNILNGICASLFFLIKNNVDKDNYKVMIQLIHKILTQNLKE